MLAEVAERPENEAVLAYLWTEQLPSWRESDSPWIVDGYLLTTHPDLCGRVEALADAAGGRFGYLHGRPAVVDERGVIVVSGDWTRADPWAAAATDALAAALRRASS